MKQRVNILVGPTAVGKSEVAIRVAEKIDAYIISADSRQVYRQMDIGTAKPSIEDRSRVPHFLVDIIDPDSTFSAGQFLRYANEIIKETFNLGRKVLVVGGTGLYVKALVEGFNLADTPRIDKIHNELTERLKKNGLASLIKELSELDPKCVDAIDTANPRRVVRALEIIKATGRSLDESRGKNSNSDNEFVVVGLRRDREELVRRITDRTNKMIEDGWIDEVEDLMKFDYRPESPAMSGIGYKELREYLEGEISLDDAIGKIIIRTRQYAKRQMTWFNAQSYINWIDLKEDDDIDSVVERVLNYFMENCYK